MSNILATTRNRIEAQGFVGFSDEELAQHNYGLRFSPMICMIWVAVGVALASPIILYALIPFALLGGIFKSHPFDIFYNYGIRHFFKAPHLPPYQKPRRFACLMASVMIATAALGFQFGIPALGYGMGIFMVVAAFLNVSTGFCVPSFIYGLMFGKGVCELEPKGAKHISS